MRIGMIGMGKLGRPAAEVMARHHDVLGYDVREVASDSVTICDGMARLVQGSDLIFVAVETPHGHLYDGSTPSSHLEPRDFDYTAVESVIDELNSIGVAGKTVVLISTVLPGTTRRRLAPRLRDAELVYNPYLIAMGTVAHDMENPEMIMIGTADGAEDRRVSMLRDAYGPIVSNGARVVVGTWEEIESTKIFYNTFISAKLSLVNMIQDVAQRLGNMDASLVARALSDSTKRITGPAYMKPGMGDGGPCHPRDNIALRWLARDLNLGYDMFDAIMRAREVQARHLAEELVRHGKRVFIWGESFKPGVPYTDGSYGRLVGHYCMELGSRVIYDAVSTEPATYLLGHDRDWSAWLANIRRGSVVVDPWNSAPDLPEITVIRYGNTKRDGATNGE